MITPDLQKNFIDTIYSLFVHNYIVFAYVFGLLISIVVCLVRPSRFSILMLLGFALLTFSFEYDKHIIAPFREQTLQSLITVKPHYKLQRIVNLFISEVLPIVFYISGWGLIYLGIILKGVKREEKK